MKKLRTSALVIASALVGWLLNFTCFAQSTEELSKQIDDLNRTLDQAVVKLDLPTLEKHYGDDFVFTHGTGHVDSKHSWLKDIQHGQFISREHDSTKVELHGDIAIVTGKLSVERKAKHGQSPQYNLRYVRVFVRRNDSWQLISHRTVSEQGL